MVLDGRGFHGNRAYKHRGYVVQDEDAAEYDYAASEWPSEYDDGAHYGWDDNEPDADEEHWSGEEIFDSQAAYYQTDAEEAHEHDYPWHDVEAYDSAYAAYLGARKRFLSGVAGLVGIGGLAVGVVVVLCGAGWAIVASRVGLA